MKRVTHVVFPDAPSLAQFTPADLSLMREASGNKMGLGDIDPYYVGLTQEQIDALEGELLPVVDHMLMDFARGYTVIIGFCERQQDDNADQLRCFIREHPEFTFLIQPLLDYDPETASAGEIDFERQGDRVKGLIKLSPMFTHQQKEEIPVELSYDLFKSFVELTESFGCHMAENGKRPLNF